MRHPVRWLAPAAVALVLAPRPAQADCAPTPLWSHTSSVTPLVSNTKLSLLNRSYHADGSALYAYRNSSGGANPPGTAAWVWSSQPEAPTLSNFPAPVPMHPGPEVLFLGGDNGRLYRIDAATGALITPPADTRRPTCTEDQIIATPAVQLYQFSNPAYQSAVDGDLIFVITKNGCNDHAQNRVIAYKDNNAVPQWTFRASRLSLHPVFESTTTASGGRTSQPAVLALCHGRGRLRQPPSPFNSPTSRRSGTLDGTP